MVVFFQAVLGFKLCAELAQTFMVKIWLMDGVTTRMNLIDANVQVKIIRIGVDH